MFFLTDINRYGMGEEGGEEVCLIWEVFFSYYFILFQWHGAYCELISTVQRKENNRNREIPMGTVPKTAKTLPASKWLTIHV